LNYKIINEDGVTAILQESSGTERSYFLDETLNIDDIEPFANNADLVEDTNDDIDFTDINPFGEL
jgi:hypothetical protein